MEKEIMTLFHLSDVHIGEPGVDEDDLWRIVDGIDREARDLSNPLILVTGDLTSDGLRDEFERFNYAVSGVSTPMVIIPGNHDERNYGAAHFERLFGERFKTYETENIALFAVDSAEPDNDAGHVGRAHYAKITDFFGRSQDKIRVFALHHHLVPVPFTGREHNVVEDSGDVLGLLDATRCSLVLNGHRHVPHIWRLNDIVIYNSGTLLSRRVRGAGTQTHTRIELMSDTVTFYLRERGRPERVYARCPLVGPL
ncbi:MAG: metallophosphoesterase [Candidatus Thorarchaeota archaeon]